MAADDRNEEDWRKGLRGGREECVEKEGGRTKMGLVEVKWNGRGRGGRQLLIGGDRFIGFMLNNRGCHQSINIGGRSVKHK